MQGITRQNSPLKWGPVLYSEGCQTVGSRLVQRDLHSLLEILPCWRWGKISTCEHVVSLSILERSRQQFNYQLRMQTPVCIFWIRKHWQTVMHWPWQASTQDTLIVLKMQSRPKWLGITSQEIDKDWLEPVFWTDPCHLTQKRSNENSPCLCTLRIPEWIAQQRCQHEMMDSLRNQLWEFSEKALRSCKVQRLSGFQEWKRLLYKQVQICYIIITRAELAAITVALERMDSHQRAIWTWPSTGHIDRCVWSD